MELVSSTSTDGDLQDTTATSLSISAMPTQSETQTEDDINKIGHDNLNSNNSNNTTSTTSNERNTREETLFTTPSLAPGLSNTVTDGVAPAESHEEDVHTIKSTDSHPEFSNDETEEQTDSESEYDLAQDLRYKDSLNSRRKNARKRNLQAAQYLLLVEDRLKELEQAVEQLLKKGIVEDTSNSPSPEPEKKMSTEPAKFSWQEWSLPLDITETYSIIEMLVEEPHSLIKLPNSANKRSLHIDTTDKEKHQPQILRIRFNSPHLVQFFQDILGHETFPSRTHYQQLYPFKAIAPCVAKLHAKIAELEVEIAAIPIATSETLVESTGTENSPVKPSLKSQPSDAHDITDESPDTVSARRDADESVAPQDDLSEKLEHMKVLASCIDEDFAAVIETHERLRPRQLPEDSINGSARIAFPELWHLFAPGDLVYDPSKAQALKVLAVRGGRAHLVDEEDAPAEATSIFSQRLKPIDQVFDFVLTCFYLDFNGEFVGPVQTEKAIPPFDGARDIKSLNIMPIEYADTQAFRIARTGAGGIVDEQHSVRDILLSRGQTFASLAHRRKVAHRDYSGFSLSAVREQIDSQVIIDLGLFYQKQPEKIPDLGLVEPPESDNKEVEENYNRPCWCAKPDCSPVMMSSRIFNDHKVDKLRTREFLDEHQLLVRFTEPVNQKQLLENDEYCILFPRQIYAFVLRSRKWHPLDVARIIALKSHPQSFEQLVLPLEHKSIVQGLVETHSRPEKTEDMDNAYREDLVRGKGKGVILLLHGVPGVGKTSTAECVAEKTKRPLFALTCGDIGDNARDVEKNLNESFQLAHRWGCVMLLDEADVFLQARSRVGDLARNAVVSVFLGMLEYYSGILFLTTNKIGSFDEAFMSRIHVSLYYSVLNEEQTLEIWNSNLERVAKTRNVTFKQKRMTRWMKEFFRRNEDEGKRQWNGRQIRNACQTVAALAVFRNNGKITSGELDAVADVGAQFDRYLKATHGMDGIARAQADQSRGDDEYMDPEYDERSNKRSPQAFKTPPRSQRRRVRSPSPKRASGKKPRPKTPEGKRDESSEESSDSD